MLLVLIILSCRTALSRTAKLSLSPIVSLLTSASRSGVSWRQGSHQLCNTHNRFHNLVCRLLDVCALKRVKESLHLVSILPYSKDDHYSLSVAV